ncbi:D-alanyl-D-alanine carboxypeptidase, partial [Streptococcus pneumoniae]|nr:D-alanyl-D-alanine carboxypeptidase [Streptococcus pneumoniae]
DNLAMELVGRSTGGLLPSELQNEPLRRADGSGLSRYNLISARQLVRVLQAYPQLGGLVPGPGEGTLAKRFLEGPAQGKVRAK